MTWQSFDRDRVRRGILVAVFDDVGQQLLQCEFGDEEHMPRRAVLAEKFHGSIDRHGNLRDGVPGFQTKSAGQLGGGRHAARG